MKKSITVECDINGDGSPFVSVPGWSDTRFPGLAVCENPTRDKERPDTHYAIVHIPSGKFFTTRKFKKLAWQLVEQVGPFGDWNKPVHELDYPTMMRPARKICLA